MILQVRRQGPIVFIVSQPSVLNLILINLILSWLMGAAIIGPPNTKYTQSIEAYREKLL